MQKNRYTFIGFRRLLQAVAMLVAGSLVCYAQQCPPNIDFESGNFDGWRFFTGSVANQGGVNVFNLSETPSPVDGRHTLVSALEGTIDPYGGFPTTSPNGSAYCVKLGNDMGGGQGEAISYEFTIPANRNTYSLIYYYAVVFQDPNHQQYEQPRMEIEITNVTDNQRINCASFSFIPFGTALPGFFLSPVMVDPTPIWCKDWTPVSINLDSLAGKSIRLTFRTGDCTFRRHFGYAYIDVDTDCSGEFAGASFCPEDKEITISAPFGFEKYTWFNSDMSRELGRSQTLTITPPPPSGTRVNVRLEPYAGYGCAQTMTTRLVANLQVTANAGRDTVSCNLAPVRIGSIPRPGLVYQWTPAMGLSNAASANPIAIPEQTTRYILTVRSPGGGCSNSDTVTVTASNLAGSLRTIGNPDVCLGTGDSVILEVGNTKFIQWYRNDIALPGQNSPRLTATQTGKYFAALGDEYGCSANTQSADVNISSIPVAGAAVADSAQCFVGNRFVFENNSTNRIGEMQYTWQLGNHQATSRDVTYSFPEPGNYAVKMVVRTNSLCADSVILPVQVFPNPIPLFQAGAICTGLSFSPLNLTNDSIGSPIHYQWELPEGRRSNLRQPDPVTFTAPGNHFVTLSVFSDQCPLPVQTLRLPLRVEAAAPAQRYPASFAIRNVPITLEARPIGIQVKWEPARQLHADTVYKPVFASLFDQEYTITLTTEGGCITTDTLLVQLVEKADIIVPGAFTPNGDGLNDVLRPVLMGIAELRYFRIFNRYGALVYETRHDRQGWDGMLNGQQQAAQAFVWMAEGIGLDGSLIHKKGSAILIR